MHAQKSFGDMILAWIIVPYRSFCFRIRSGGSGRDIFKNSHGRLPGVRSCAGVAGLYCQHWRYRTDHVNEYYHDMDNTFTSGVFPVGSEGSRYLRSPVGYSSEYDRGSTPIFDIFHDREMEVEKI